MKISEGCLVLGVGIFDFRLMIDRHNSLDMAAHEVLRGMDHPEPERDVS